MIKKTSNDCKYKIASPVGWQKGCYEERRIRKVDSCFTGNNVPEGMVEYEEQKYGYADEPLEGGLTIGGKDAIYLEFQSMVEEGKAPFKKLYASYPDEHYVMELFIFSNVTKEEGIKFAEGISLRPVTETDEVRNIVSDYTWSEYLESLADTDDNLGWISISKDEFQTRSIGEKLEIGSVSACVEKVEIFDNINILLPGYVDIRQ